MSRGDGSVAVPAAVSIALQWSGGARMAAFWPMRGQWQYALTALCAAEMEIAPAPGSLRRHKAGRVTVTHALCATVRRPVPPHDSDKVIIAAAIPGAVVLSSVCWHDTA